MKKFVRKLTKASTHSYLVNVPKALVKKYGWKEKQKLTISDEGHGRVVVKDWKRR